MGRASKWGNVVAIQKRTEELGEKSGIWSKRDTLMCGVMWTFRAMAGGSVREQGSAKRRDGRVTVCRTTLPAEMAVPMPPCLPCNK